MDAFLGVVRALSHRERVRVVKLLQFTSMGVSGLAAILEQSEAEVQDHIAILGEADVVVPVKGEDEEIYRINPERSNLYAAVVLALLDGWLNEDPEVKKDRKRAERMLGK
ncbi:MAG: winged helix-turn-helix transcriptional regulator [Candidatus Eisenbacteria sp.]|nr:winged helix-turn-helix transcriptional regulator [Candidatus Eisenbacteria bacterium]